jgi:hypothetical protein
MADVFQQRYWLGRVWLKQKSGDKLIGTAFAVDRRHLLTCDHVIRDAGASGPGQKVYVDFPLRGGPGYRCTVLEDGWRPTPGPREAESKGDLALLEMPEDAPDLVPLPLRVRQRSYDGLRFTSYGFPVEHPESDIAHGRLSLFVGLEWLRVEPDSEALLQPGFSGAPVFVEDLEGAVGIVVTRDTEDGRAAYSVPMNVIARSSAIITGILEGPPLSWLDRAPRSLRAETITSARTIIDGHTRDFVGRNFVFAAIDRHLDGGPAGYLVIKGQPGIGKSAIVASLAARRGYPHHFNVFAANIRSAETFLANICAQVIAKYELPYRELPRSATQNSGLLVTLLEEAIAQGCGETPRIVLLVDALDEAETPRPGVNRLYLPQRLPDGCYVIATIRKGVDEQLSIEQRLPGIEILENSPENEADIKAYIAGFLDKDQPALAQLPDFDAERFIDTLWCKSEGNFMYVHHMLDSIRKAEIPLSEFADPSRLPQGLQAYYERHWSLMQSGDRTRRRDLQEPVVCFLAKARESVPAAMVSEWMNDSGKFGRVDERDVEELLDDEWAQFVHKEPGPPSRYRLYHRTFLEFLEAKVRLDRYGALIADAMRNKVDWSDADL